MRYLYPCVLEPEERGGFVVGRRLAVEDRVA